MTHGRTRIAAALGAGTLSVALALQAATPASAEPDIDTVKQKVDRLYHEAEQASERYNRARDELDASRTKLTALRSDLRRQERIVGTMRRQVADLVVEQYQEGGLSTATQVVTAEDPDTFIDNLNALSSYDAQRSQVMATFTTQLDRLDLRRDAAADEVAGLSRTKKKLAREKAVIDDKAADAKELLGRLEAEERAKLSSAGDTGALPEVSASGRAGAAVSYALAQVGDAYSWGAEGPSAFDCSGLTKASWAQAGVALPHSSGGQMGSGARVSSSSLQPGDLVFYYSPVSHVGIYIGGGKIVHAANPGTGVQVAGVFSMPFSGAVRPG